MTFEFILKQHASAGGLRSEVADLLKSTIHPAYSNLALCYLKLHNYGLVLTFANQVLASDPDNLKNLYRRALARKATKAYEEAQQDLHKVATLDPSMEQECKRLVHECRLLQREQRQKEKAAAREFIQGYSQ